MELCMVLRVALLSLATVTLTACSTMETVELDEYTLTTANGVRFRVAMEGDGQCAYNTYHDSVGWGLYPSTIEQDGNVRRNAKFNFVLRPAVWDQAAREAERDISVVRAHHVVEDFWGDAQVGCGLWEAAPEDLKQVHRSYYEDAIRGFFEAATRFEAATKRGREALLAEGEIMRAKYEELKTRRPDSLSLNICRETRVTEALYRCPSWFHAPQDIWFRGKQE
jgi:hypothetical protein